MKTHWVAEMFSALRDCGENVSIVFGFRLGRDAAAEVQWFELPHDRFDGVSGFATLLRAAGLGVVRVPERGVGPLSWRRSLRGVLTVLPTMGVRRQQWSQPFDWTNRAAPRTPGERVAWRSFGADETVAIVLAAKNAGVSVNTYLLRRLDAAVAGRLVPRTADRRWMIPVNLRSGQDWQADPRPRMAFWGVDLPHDPSDVELQRQMDALNARAYHWGTWTLLQIGALLGREGLRRDIRRRDKLGHGATGMFSNLGRWEAPNAGVWLFCPAVTRVYPIGAGCLTVNGRMALTLQLHDALGRDLAAAAALLDEWCDAALADTPAAALGDTPGLLATA